MDQLPAAFIEHVFPLLSEDSLKKTVDIDGDFSKFGSLAVNRRFNCFIQQVSDGTVFVEEVLEDQEARYAAGLAPSKHNYNKGYGSLTVAFCMSQEHPNLTPELLQNVLRKQYFVREFTFYVECQYLSKKDLEIMAQWNVTDVLINCINENVIEFLKTFELRNQIRSLTVSGDSVTNSLDVFLPFTTQFQFSTLSVNIPVRPLFFENIGDFWKCKDNAKEMRGKMVSLPWVHVAKFEAHENEAKRHLQNDAWFRL
ncbi:hypothetical protein L596_025479 [Steinernema carpocapsae]|uniref:Uncharacterized protein n=1 Tax=Steinernema carpocapsae TaxID=34508 RepID=A0A4V5ZYV1_STECR|nr:hypothetical protein L596_025479 [Steinernema carpocapsae]